jgi:ADP-heptose:LPS heptosyltransferase
VAARLIHATDARVLVFAGRGEKALARELVALLPPKRAVALAGLPLAEAASALARLSVLVANHAGVAHLAAAVGTPVVAVSPSTAATPFDLLGGRHIHVRKLNVEAVAADDVYDAACRLLSLNRAELLAAR